MALVGSVDLVAKSDVSKGGEISLLDLFPMDELTKEFEMIKETGDLKAGQTKMRVNIDKLGFFETVPAVNRFQYRIEPMASCFWLVDREYLETKLTASEDVIGGRSLKVSFETIE